MKKDMKLSDVVRSGNLLATDCPSRGVLEHVTSRWAVLLFMVLQDGTHRFSELHRKLGGVSEKMLAQTLRALEDDGFVERRAFATVPPHVDYTLTALGHEVAAHVVALADWVQDHVGDVMAARQRPREEAAPEPGRQVVRAGRPVSRPAPGRRRAYRAGARRACAIRA